MPHRRIGFMQGRLSPPIGGCIQAFPWLYWRQEFRLAQELGIGLMEWTLDQELLYENPLMTSDGRSEIRRLCTKHCISIPSLTGDCFMQAPFWKAEGAERETFQKDFLSIIESATRVGIEMIVVPLVDNGRLDNSRQEDDLVSYLQRHVDFLKECGIKVLFESEFSAPELARFIDRLNPDVFGVNYDIGNSAALRFDPEVEIAAYGQRILNVHIKDRTLGGTTVPLGTGNASFRKVFKALASVGYKNNYILQTARATDGDHAAVLRRYRDMTADWIIQYGA